MELEEVIEALDRLFKCNDDDYTLGYQQHDYNLVKETLKQFIGADVNNEKVKEAIEDLNELKEVLSKQKLKYEGIVGFNLETIEQALQSKSLAERCWEIVKEKNVNKYVLSVSISVEQYNSTIKRMNFQPILPYEIYYKLTESEFNTLKEGLK